MITKRFALGFAVGFIALLLINLLAAHLASDCGLAAVFGRSACADDMVRLGWPLQFYEAGVFAYRNNFNPGMLSLDIGTVFLGAIAFGWLFSPPRK